MTGTGPSVEEPRIRVALMSYTMDRRPAKGTALYTRKLIEAIIEDPRLEVTLVHYEAVDDPLYRQAREIIMPRVRLPYGSRFASQMLWFWRQRRDPFDLIHWFQPRLYPFFWKAPAKKIVVTFHGGGDVTSGDRFVFSRAVFNRIAKSFHHRIDGIIADSRFARTEVALAYGIPEERVTGILIGASSRFAPLPPPEAARRMAERYGASRPYILSVSRLQHHKNVISLVRAYILGRELGYFDEQLLVVGVPAGDEKPIYELARGSSYAEDILFRDFVAGEDLNAAYAAARLFVFPSLNEGFGMPLVEAMASGTPVVSSNATSLPEVGGDAVLYADPLDIEALARQMRVALTDEAVRNDLIRRGLERAGTFSWTKTGDETIRLYERMLRA